MRSSGIISPEVRLDRLPAGVVSFDDDGVVIAANATFADLLQCSVEDVCGTRLERFLSVPSRIFYHTHVFPLLKVQCRADEIYMTLLGQENAEVPVLMNGRRFTVGSAFVNECVFVAMSRRDVFENEILAARRKAEAMTKERDRAYRDLENSQEELQERNRELQALHHSLESKVETRTQELKKMVQHLEGFNYSIAHDLRAPLRAILSTTATLTADEHEPLTENQLLLLARQKFNAAKMSALIDGLLIYSRLALRPLNRRKVDLTALGLASGRAASADNGAKNIRVDVEPGLVAYADHFMADALVYNLIDNALKFSPRGGVVSFRKSDKGFSVSDEGIGVEEQYRERIFKVFERLHRDEEFPGTGIGLAIAARVVERHGGEIWLESTPGKGSIFYFSFGKDAQ